MCSHWSNQLGWNYVFHPYPACQIGVLPGCRWGGWSCFEVTGTGSSERESGIYYDSNKYVGECWEFIKIAKDFLSSFKKKWSPQARDFNCTEEKAILDRCTSPDAFSICGPNVLPSQVCKTGTLLYILLKDFTKIYSAICLDQDKLDSSVHCNVPLKQGRNNNNNNNNQEKDQHFLPVGKS